jgi:predicted N-acyltransferase
MNTVTLAPSLRFVSSIEEIGRDRWNALTGTTNPFTRYEFLHALETTGCTSEKSGWQPHHAVVYRGSGGTGNSLEDRSQLLAVMPLYLKTNSWGEYVFDWSWANAYQSYGFDYYPKLVTAAPFTPSSGRRIFIDESQDREALLKLLIAKTEENAGVLGASSWHVLFPLEEEYEALSDLGLLRRIATQFHWQNRDYESFDDFLNDLNSRKRKSIRKERKQVSEQGISFRITEGEAISDEQWSDFYLYYQTTYLSRGMQGYLKRVFFKTIATTMPEQIFLVNAVKDGKDIAAALFFKNGEKLFGRYWGCRSEYQFLHFETCYYQGLDYAIKHGLRVFDAGAQGEHKIQRGFRPITTYSSHWIANKGFSDAIENFLKEERPHILGYQRDASSLLPFRNSDQD